jgi:hypothetical protein
LADLSTKNYKEQAIWFLNAFWDDFAKDQAEKIWSYKHQMDQLDLEKKAEGNAVDELQAHRFLEKFQETLTVTEMRENLRSTGAISGTVKLVPLIHILIFKYKVDWKFLVTAPQGSREEINKAQALLDEVTLAFQESEARAVEASAALREAQSKETAAKSREAEAKRTEAEAKAREAEARAREDEARQQEAPFKAAQEEVDRALADVKSQEDARDQKTNELQRKSNEGGVVQQNKAKAELAQHLAEDPLPLRKAKITLEAALKKAEKARAPFEAATKQAEAARAIAEEAATQASAARKAAESARADAERARERSEQAAVAAEQALEDARRSLEEAERYLQEVKSRMPHGRSWWMEKELEERRKYLPKSKGGLDKK